jgi:hypothetical protein
LRAPIVKFGFPAWCSKRDLGSISLRALASVWRLSSAVMVRRDWRWLCLALIILVQDTAAALDGLAVLYLGKMRERG